VSYGAGLTPIHFWRFAVATLFGLLPMSFILAHFGGEISDKDLDVAMFYIVFAGVILMLPIVLRWITMNVKKSP
jgi:uncharacterized membrane protein YdjX (TVP38/TMEM64 family)